MFENFKEMISNNNIISNYITLDKIIEDVNFRIKYYFLKESQ